MKPIGNPKLYLRVKGLLLKVNHVFYKGQRVKLQRQLSEALLAYYEQPMSIYAGDIYQWHSTLSKQLTNATQCVISPGMVDSKGWLSVIIELYSGSMIFLLFDEIKTLEHA